MPLTEACRPKRRPTQFVAPQQVRRVDLADDLDVERRRASPRAATTRRCARSAARAVPGRGGSGRRRGRRRGRAGSPRSRGPSPGRPAAGRRGRRRRASRASARSSRAEARRRPRSRWSSPARRRAATARSIATARLSDWLRGSPGSAQRDRASASARARARALTASSRSVYDRWRSDTDREGRRTTWDCSERLAEGPVICAEGYLFELERRGYVQAGPFVPGGRARGARGGRGAAPRVRRRRLGRRRGVHLLRPPREAARDRPRGRPRAAQPHGAARSPTGGRRRVGRAVRRQHLQHARLRARRPGDARRLPGDVRRAGRVGRRRRRRLRDRRDVPVLRGGAARRARRSSAPGFRASRRSRSSASRSPSTACAVAEACRRLADAGADVVGLNCMRGPRTMLPLLGPIVDALDVPVAALPVPYRTTEETPAFVSLCDAGYPSPPGGRAFPTALDPLLCNRYEIADFTRERRRARGPLSRPVLRRRPAPHPRDGRGARPHAAGEPLLRRHGAPRAVRRRRRARPPRAHAMSSASDAGSRSSAAASSASPARTRSSSAGCASSCSRARASAPARRAATPAGSCRACRCRSRRPGMLATGLRSALDPHGALVIRPALDTSWLRWLWQFRRNCSPERFRRGVLALVELNRTTLEQFDAYAAEGIEFESHATRHADRRPRPQGADVVHDALRRARPRRLRGRDVGARPGGAARELEPALSDAVGAVAAHDRRPPRAAASR